MSRIETIRKLLERSPGDLFLLYSLGMELLSAGEARAALEQFTRIIELDADNLPAYQQAAKAHQALGDKPAAADMLRRGIALAERKGDLHARDRMQPVLDALLG